MTHHKARVLILDDEPGGIYNLQHYLGTYCPEIEVTATATSIAQFMALVQENNFDVAFLDVQVCDDNIFDALKTIDKPPFEIVFVTAYSDYAVRAFRVDALDYLVKPLSQQNILECYRKILYKLGRNAEAVQRNEVPQTPTNKKLLLKQGDLVYVIRQQEVIYLKARGVYTEVHFEYKGAHTTILLSKSLNTLENEYDKDIFFRVHKSYLVNIHKVVNLVKSDTSGITLTTNDVLPLAKRRSTEFYAFINRDK